MPGITRRHLLSATALMALPASASARTVTDGLPWQANQAYPPVQVTPGPWVFFTETEAGMVEVIVDRLVPADELGPGGKACGCAVFIDRQLAGPYGGHDWLYMQGPFPPNPLPSQGLQSPVTPRDQYRRGLAALASYVQSTFGRTLPQLTADEQDKLLTSLEKGEAKLPGEDGKSLFTLMLANTIEGYFADPVYGGNQGMAGWKLVGFPGTRYNYRDVMEKPNQAYTLPPVGLRGRPEWSGRRS